MVVLDFSFLLVCFLQNKFKTVARDIFMCDSPVTQICQ